MIWIDRCPLLIYHNNATLNSIYFGRVKWCTLTSKKSLPAPLKRYVVWKTQWPVSSILLIRISEFLHKTNLEVLVECQKLKNSIVPHSYRGSSLTDVLKSLKWRQINLDFYIPTSKMLLIQKKEIRKKSRYMEE